ncbi:MAG: TM2 domain-containing protein [Desulfovibrionaceae bacterium]|nr:TM2 domain-containing protein [Desulfovibrionaceae bacterium]
MVLFLAAWTILDIYLAVTGKITADAEGNPLASGEPKYQSVCLLFAIIGGFYGFDRFYLGHRVLGLLKIFTFGGLFVWYGLDIILAILNAHKDSSGRPLAQG